MEGINRLILTALAVLASACAVEESGGEQAEQTTDVTAEAAPESCYEQGVVTVKFTEEMAEAMEASLAEGSVTTKSSEMNGLITAYGVTSIKRVFSDDERWLERQRREGLHLWYEIAYDPSAEVATRAAAELGDIPGVEIAEPNPKIRPAAYYYNDIYFYQQWHLSSAYDINVEPVWEYFTKGSSDVIVAVVDEGIDQNHPDLKPNLIAAGERGSKNFVDNSYNITAGGHGTHVAGIISAVSNNGIGVAGIAGGDYQAEIAGARMLSCQIFATTSSGDDVSASLSNTAEAIKYGADNGALISQNSWGYSYDTESQAMNGYTPQVIKTAIDYFVKYAGCDNTGNQLSTSLMKGGVVIFAAGNEGWRYAHPADYEPVIAVGATDRTGARAYYSNYGSWVDICAPGTDVYSTYYSGGSTYSNLSGTSMACPMVSGVAALVISCQGGQGFTSNDLRTCLIDGATSDKVSAQNVGPYLDAFGAVTYGVDISPQPIDSYSVSASGNILHFTWKVPASDATSRTPAYGTMLYASTDINSINNLDPKNPASNVIAVSVLTDSRKVGEEITEDLTVNKFSTTYYVTCVPYNLGPYYADKAPVKVVTTGRNNPPTITPSIDLSDVFEVRASAQKTITFTIADPDGHDVTVEYRPKSVVENWSKTGGNTYTLTITGYAHDSSGKPVAPGTYSPLIIATDAYGLSCDPFRFTYAIVANRAPEVGENMRNVLLRMDTNSTKTASLDLSTCFTDPDGDDLTFTVENSSSSTVQALVSYTTFGDTYVPTLHLTANKAGTAVITVVAADAAGLSCSQTITAFVMAAGESVVAYPNPCTDVLHIGIASIVDTATAVTITSSTGSLVYSGTVTASAFNPAAIDVKTFAPGTYSVNVRYGTTDVTKKVVKN